MSITSVIIYNPPKKRNKASTDNILFSTPSRTRNRLLRSINLQARPHRKPQHKTKRRPRVPHRKLRLDKPKPSLSTTPSIPTPSLGLQFPLLAPRTTLQRRLFRERHPRRPQRNPRPLERSSFITPPILYPLPPNRLLKLRRRPHGVPAFTIRSLLLPFLSIPRCRARGEDTKAASCADQTRPEYGEKCSYRCWDRYREGV
jgi:hypothetical protein